MNEIQSIWDGWEKQCYNIGYDDSGAFCARGYLYCRPVLEKDLWASTEERVGRYIQTHYTLPRIYSRPGCDLPTSDPRWAIVYANNELKLTPDEFRRIDRETQIEAAVKPLVDSVPTFLVTDANDGEALTKLEEVKQP